MATVRLVSFLLLVLFSVAAAQNWRGNTCSYRVCINVWKRACVYGWQYSCCRYRWQWVPTWVTRWKCCRGYTDRNNDRNCVIPVCTPKCQNGGTCIRPGVCQCPSTHTGWRCANAVCSYLSPCYPGTCTTLEQCDCWDGFQSPPSSPKQNFCLDIKDNDRVNLTLTEMEVRLAFRQRHGSQEERYWIKANSANPDLTANEMDVFWTNRKGFNYVQTTCSSQYFPPDDIPDTPPYVNRSGFGIVAGEIELWLKKLKRGDADGIPRQNSLNETISCLATVSATQPESDVYNCSVIDPEFNRNLEHLDALKFTFKTKGGGFRDLKNTDTGAFYRTQIYGDVIREKSVEFRFDFEKPYHCEESNNCTNGERMLSVPDLTKNNRITIAWNGWQDTDSKMDRFAWEVFKMTRTLQNELEIQPHLALSPLINTEVMAANYTDQSFVLPSPGMYSVILEAGDLANNTKFVRRLVLYDPDPQITTDPDHAFYVSTASEAADFHYQSHTDRVVFTWDQHFRNALHEDNALLGAVRQYPNELRDDELSDSNGQVFRKTIPQDNTLFPAIDDHEGRRTIQEIPNKRAIVKFEIQHVNDNIGGRNKTDPSNAWIDVNLTTTFTYPLPVTDDLTVTFWVKAIDVMGTEKVERTQVSFDSTSPNVGQLDLDMNVHVPGIDFSSMFTMEMEDVESGIAYILYTFTRSNGTIIHQQRVPGKRVPKADCPFTSCRCTKTDECFPLIQTYALSNCLMMVEKENLSSEVINITADVTNMAGLVTRRVMQKNDLTVLNGTEAYFPPQNITVKTITSTSVTFTWSFPPSCFPRTQLWVIVNGEKIPVHPDAHEYTLSGLSAGQPYTVFMVTEFTANAQSERAQFAFETMPEDDDGLSGGAIAGIIIGFLIIVLLVAIIIIFILWRRGKIFQKEGTPVNKQLNRVSRAFDNVRRTVRGETSAFQNNAYKADQEQDEIYLYGSMAFGTRQAWQLEDSSLTLLENIGEGRFASIFKATWTHDKKRDTVAAKMLKAGFTEDDALKMMAKINFMATQLEDHDNVIRFLGAVTDNAGWGPVLVMEYCEVGQMDRWLRNHKASMSEQVMDDLFQFSLGIAKGMEYIASKKLTHKRLAARNILLNFLKEPKVAGFGPQHQEGEDRATRVPAKWASPEVLQEKPQTEKSDVWSYGIVLWEIFSMGEVPYPGIHAGEIGTRLKSGYRMDKPEYADDMYYEQMKDCWQFKPNKRPTFSTLRLKLAQQFSPTRQSGDFYYDTNELKG